nr:hypothetical protein [Pseudomonas arcuscaelestis]
MIKPEGPLPPDHEAYLEAVEAMRRYHEAQATRQPAGVVERLRIIAEAQFQAVTDYQLRAWGRPGSSIN